MFVSICTFLRREDNNFSFYINDITHVFYAVGVVISIIFYRLLFFSFLWERYVAAVLFAGRHSLRDISQDGCSAVVFVLRALFKSLFLIFGFFRNCYCLSCGAYLRALF